MKNIEKIYTLLQTYSFLYLKDKSQTISQSYNCTISANVGFGKCIQEKNPGLELLLRELKRKTIAQMT